MLNGASFRGLSDAEVAKALSAVEDSNDALAAQRATAEASALESEVERVERGETSGRVREIDPESGPRSEDGAEGVGREELGASDRAGEGAACDPETVDPVQRGVRTHSGGYAGGVASRIGGIGGGREGMGGGAGGGDEAGGGRAAGSDRGWDDFGDGEGVCELSEGHQRENRESDADRENCNLEGCLL